MPLDFPFQELEELKKTIQKENDYLERCANRNAYETDGALEGDVWQGLEEQKTSGSGTLALPARPKGLPPKVRIVGSKRVVGAAVIRQPPAVQEYELRNLFRVPMLGEPVLLDGLRGQPQVNGMCAQVISNGADADGFVKVRLQDSGGGGSGSLKGRRAAADAESAGFKEGMVLRVRYERLRPMHGQKSASISELTGGRRPIEASPEEYRTYPDWASVRTCSENASAFSRRSESLGIGGRSVASRASMGGSSVRSGSTAALSASWLRQHIIPDKNHVPTKIII